MDQFRQVGEVLGSLKALMVLKHEIQINQRQCCLLFDMLTFAFETISEEIRQHLRFEDRNTKWKALDLPMKELHKVFKEAELYIKHCIDVKNWWGRAISLHTNKDCVELHIHNLLCCFPVVIEAIETAAEISGVDQEDMQKRRVALTQKYDQECDDPKLFLWKFGKQYIVPREICHRLEYAWKEDRWLLLEKLEEKKTTAKHEQRLGELLIRKLSNGGTKGKLLPSNALVGAQDYFVRRRLGSGYPSGGGHLKEIHWLGESFAMRNFYGSIDPLHAEISSVLSLSHPNVLQYLCAFYDEDRNEGFLVMELMSKNLGACIKEHSGQRNRIPFSIPVAVDIMLQIARGMEYLHSRKIYHGDLNPSNVLLKAKHASIGGFQAKITGFGMTSVMSSTARSPKPTGVDLDIWLAPEVLAEIGQPDSKCSTKYTDKADVYSFGMLCFTLLTGKVPFEDGHLQGEKMARNIRAGERPLFSYPSPKYLSNLTKKCWQTNPNQRPTFSSICRILRYIKKNLVINPDHGDPDSPPPLVDYYDLETGYLKKLPGEGSEDLAPVSQIPFQMFTYKVVEREKISGKKWDLATEGSVHRAQSVFDDEQMATMDDLFLAPSDRRSVCSEIIDSKNPTLAADMRSVISETPHRKLFLFDQRKKKCFDNGPKTTYYPAPEKRYDQNLTGENPVEVQDKIIIASKVAESQLPSPRPRENGKSELMKVMQQKVEITEILEKKQSLKPIGERKPASVESSQGRISSQATAGCQNLAENLEKGLEQNTESIPKSVLASSTTSTKTEPPTTSIQEPGNSENSRKKSKRRKSKDRKNEKSTETPNEELPRSSTARMKKTKLIWSPASSPARALRTCGSSEKPKDDSPRSPSSTLRKIKTIFSSSPARAFRTPENDSPRSSPTIMKKMMPSFSPASSPSRPLKTCGSSEIPKGYSPCASPARMKKSIPSFSTASSPSRAFKPCASPKRSPASHLKDHSPPKSPMSPCTRCSRLSRQSSLPVAMSQQEPQIDHESTQVT
ncbi:Light-sensor Protein kinase [Sesamum angolense]|uniref:Light-sensor Protein kinase n=1 Tax=Sesamum angolense TaxID=2727404 RepID=A0AAE2BKY7_9LAMI|nr:Light-sensor Protein kinase [Sesamum angolense]